MGIETKHGNEGRADATGRLVLAVFEHWKPEVWRIGPDGSSTLWNVETSAFAPEVSGHMQCSLQEAIDVIDVPSPRLLIDMLAVLGDAEQSESLSTFFSEGASEAAPAKRRIIRLPVTKPDPTSSRSPRPGPPAVVIGIAAARARAKSKA